VRGIILRKLPRVITYEGVIPVNFVLKLPKIEQPRNINYDCSADEYLCKLMNKTEAMYKTLAEGILDKQNTPHRSSRTGRGLFNAIGEIDKYLFGKDL